MIWTFLGLVTLLEGGWDIRDDAEEVPSKQGKAGMTASSCVIV